MGVLLIYPLLFICLVVPPALIYRAPSPAGWKKAAWVCGCLLAALAPVVLTSIGLVLAVKFGGYERTAKSMLFGPEATVMAISNIAVFVLPWVIYRIFKVKHAKSHP